MKLTLLGIDISKYQFYLHGVDSRGNTVLRKKLYRDELLSYIADLTSCRIVVESCGGSHHWCREFEKLGHFVQMISPQYVKPFVKRNKNDWKDAEAIAEAAQRPTMRYVPRRREWQQDIQNLHRVRERLVKSRTALVNEIRGLLQEYGIVISRGRVAFASSFLEVMLAHEEKLSELCKETFYELWSEYLLVHERIVKYEKKLQAIGKSDPKCKRLLTIPGIGYLTATALIAAVSDAHAFKNGRELAAWLGLTPREHSTGGKQRLYGISKRGDSYLRKLLIHGARAIVYRAKQHNDQRSMWVENLKQRKGTNKASVALANKNARVAWALLIKDEQFRCLPLAA